MGDTVLCVERGEKLSGGRDTVVSVDMGEFERWAIKYCAERGENLSDGLEKLSGVR